MPHICFYLAISKAFSPLQMILFEHPIKKYLCVLHKRDQVKDRNTSKQPFLQFSAILAIAIICNYNSPVCTRVPVRGECQNISEYLRCFYALIVLLTGQNVKTGL